VLPACGSVASAHRQRRLDPFAVASPYKSAYIAAKHGLIGFAKTIALETADTDITSTRSAELRAHAARRRADRLAGEGARPSEQQVIEEIMLKPMPKRAFVTVEELGGIVEFLASDVARNITGQWIAVDGDGPPSEGHGKGWG